MVKKTNGTKSPMNKLKHLLLVATVLLIAALFIAPVAAAQTPADINKAITDGTSIITLDGDVNIAPGTDTIKIGSGKDVTIIGNGHSINRAGANFFLIEVLDGGKLTLQGGTGGLTIDGKKDSYTDQIYGLILVNGTGTQLIMAEGVTLTNSDVSLDTHIMPKNADDKRGHGVGGAVQVLYGATFTMNGGDITKNDAKYGGGVFVREGKASFTLLGGSISENTVTDTGGGVYVGNIDDMFTMNGGEITKNTAGTTSGGVHNQGTMELISGKITFNTAGTPTSWSGGGIFNYGKLTIRGGEISDNSAAMGAGISNAQAGTYPGELTILGGDIVRNKVSGNNAGGGIIVNGGTVTISGGKISDNVAERGGAIAFKQMIDDQTTFSVSGTPIISGNTLKDGKTPSNILIHSNELLIKISAPLTKGAEIGITTDPSPDTAAGKSVAFTEKSDDDYSSFFTSDLGSEKYSIKYKEGVLYHEVNKYTITWKNETATLKTEEYAYGEMPVYVGTPTKDETDKYTYTFKDWTPAVVAATKDATYTAVFEATVKEYDITTKAEATQGTVTVTVDNSDVTKAKVDSMVAVDVAPKEGYKLDKITYTPEGGDAVPVTVTGTRGTFTMPAKEVTVTVTFAKEIYSVSAGQSSNGKVTIASSTAEYDSDVTVTVEANEGYTFDKLTVTPVTTGVTAPTVTDKTFTMPASDVIVTATFTPLTFDVTKADGIINGDLETFPQTAVAFGTPVSLTAVPTGSYVLETVTVTKTGDSQTIVPVTVNGNAISFTMPAYAVTVSATFAENIVAVNTAVDTPGAGTISATVGGAAVVGAEKGKDVVVTAEPATGYAFSKFVIDGVSGEIAENPYTIENIQTATTVTAYFVKQQFTVDIADDMQNGKITAPTAESKVEYGANVDVTVAADPGYDFEKLIISPTNLADGTAYTTTEQTFTMPAYDVTVSATFVAKAGIVKSGAVPTGVTLTSSPTNPKTGEEVGITATFAEGYKLTNFIVTNKAGETIATITENPGTFIMPAEEATVSVFMEKISYDLAVEIVAKGTISVAKEGAAVTTANKDDALTITATPAAGYKLDTLSVKESESGNMVTVTDGSSINEKTFTMPACAVTITATFVVENPDAVIPDDNTPQTPVNPADSGSSSGSSTWLPSEPTQQPTQTPTEQPTTPTDTVPTDIPSTQPTATPASPGFGILAALAGLGAVAALRRQ